MPGKSQPCLNRPIVKTNCSSSIRWIFSLLYTWMAYWVFFTWSIICFSNSFTGPRRSELLNFQNGWLLLTIPVLKAIHTSEWTEQHPGIMSAPAIYRPNCLATRKKSNLLLCTPLKCPNCSFQYQNARFCKCQQGHSHSSSQKCSFYFYAARMICVNFLIQCHIPFSTIDNQFIIHDHNFPNYCMGHSHGNWTKEGAASPMK